MGIVGVNKVVAPQALLVYLNQMSQTRINFYSRKEFAHDKSCYQIFDQALKTWVATSCTKRLELILNEGINTEEILEELLADKFESEKEEDETIKDFYSRKKSESSSGEDDPIPVKVIKKKVIKKKVVESEYESD